MTTHLYCVLPRQLRDTPPHGVNGVAGALVRALPVETLVAWVSDADQAGPASIERIRAHNDVVEAAMETGLTPVPARYGQRFRDDDACRAALAREAESVSGLLAAMQGFVEMTILITPSTPRMVQDLEPVVPEMFDPRAAGAGRRYLDTLRKRELRTGEISQATEQLAEEVARVASPFIERARAHATATPMPLRTVSHLVRRDQLAGYRAAVGQVQPPAGYRFLVVGPRAPYSFSALGPPGAGSAHGMTLAE